MSPNIEVNIFIELTAVGKNSGEVDMDGITKTLSEQLQISEREIEQRKRLLDLTQEDEAILRRYQSTITTRIEPIVEKFYEIQTQIPEITLLIGDLETLRRLSNAMRGYVSDLFSGSYDSEYVNKRLRIGKIHHRIGVSPKLYISAVHLLMTILLDEIRDINIKENMDHSPESLRNSLQKVLMFDIQLVFDTYIAGLLQHVQIAHQQLESYANSLEQVVAERTAQLEAISRQDELTGLYNLRAFYENLRRELAAGERYNHSVSLIFIDLNRFKEVNDTHGHEAGNALLRNIAETILASIRITDYACRYGGDEFCLILPRTDNKQAAEMANRLLAAFKLRGFTSVYFSIGISTSIAGKPVDISELIKEADERMYNAKKIARSEGGSRVINE